MDQLLWAKPKPFLIHRNSRLTFNIKASISARLSQYLGDYTDDAFLEYITVLICNGKDQARDDLEAILGERIEEFVSWLWWLLSEYDPEVPGIGLPNSDCNMDHECKDISQNFKKSSVATNDLKTFLERGLLDVKEKLNQFEIDMSKLRSKQEFGKNDGKTNHLLNSGAQKESQETGGSRTVLVTNVHFAATSEDLSLHFAKCGVVDNVIIQTDPVTSKPKGSAYVTFASKESVDKAVALSGMSFFYRTLKVLRMAGAAPEVSTNKFHHKQQISNVGRFHRQSPIA